MEDEKLTLGVNAVDDEDVIRLSEPSCKATRMFYRDTFEGLRSAIATARNAIRQMDCTPERKTAMASHVKQMELRVKAWRKEISEATKEVEAAKRAAGTAFDMADGVAGGEMADLPDGEAEPGTPVAAAQPRPRSRQAAPAGPAPGVTTGLPPGGVTQAGK